MLQSLFPQTSNNNSSSSSQQAAPLLQFRAGKCQLTPKSNGKFLVQADLRRGQLSLIRSSSDGLLHFRWSNITNGIIEDDKIIMPGEYIFKKVKTGKLEDRVYQLKFHQSTSSSSSPTSQHLLFWLQSKDSSQDEENVKKLNGLLSGTTTATPATATTANNNGPTNLASTNWLEQMLR